ncbi:MAG: carboxypeptidase regulatory-like domain-containing protein, partial [Mycobacterium sp.]
NDGNSRWMASIAMDHVGNIALGYSISSTSMYPSAAFTGQNVGGPSGVMDAGETVFLTGSGVQEGNDDRWGDYSAMMPDPTDDCTFWTSQEYISQTGGQWSTALGSFKFDNCSIGPTGIVEGTVTDASSGDPISGATVTFTPGGSVATTNGSGQYSITLAPGDYTATASALGYEPQSASVTVSNGGTTEQDFALQSASGATLSGIVYDTGHHYPLFAEVVIDAGSQQVADVLTGANGKYSVSLPTGTTYTMTATPYLSGYTPGTATVTLSGDTQQQFGLSPDASCSAPGYSSANGSCEAIPGGLVMGKAFDANTKQVLSGVTVTDESGNTTTTGPVNGQVGFVMFEPTGSHTLTFASSQYQDATKDVSVSNGAVVPVWVGLNAGQLGVRPTSQTLNVPVGTQQSFALQIGNTGLAPVDWTLTSINSPPSRPQRKGQGVNVPLHTISGHFSPASLMTLAKEGRAANAVRPSGPVLSPAQGSSAWAAVADYPIPVLDNCAAAAPSGTVYSVGGDSDVAVTAAGYAYDPSSNSWSSIASLPEGLEKPACAFIGGKLYVTAGWDSSGNNNSTLYIYDPSSDSWSTGASMTVSVGGAPGDAVVNGDFYVIGGCGNSSSCPGTTGVEVYDS